MTGAKAGPGQGMLAVKLTDAPLPLDSVKEVNVFVERIDARRARTDSDSVSEHMDDDGAEHDGGRRDSTLWVTIATPNQSFNLLALQNGVTAFLGATPVDTGHFKSVRLIIDPAKSNIVLLDGTVLTTTSTPPVEFENSHRHGLLVELEDSLEVDEGSTTTVTLDLKLNQSITLRGHSVRDGFLFRPVVNGRCHRDH
ncbi:MAG: DUF4382 domain-containing protein [Gemmatimonadaceae bacterium]